MTMQIHRSERIAGFPLMRVRAFFCFVLGWHHTSLDIESLHERLDLSKGSASELAQELQIQGYVRDMKNGSYELTDKGRALAGSSAAGKIKRTTVEAALAGLLHRVEQYNSDENKLLAIDIVVFGSFLGASNELGDLDVAVKSHYRDPKGLDFKKAFDYARRMGRDSMNFGDCLYWPEREVRIILKARKRTIRILDWNSFLTLAAENLGRFNYKVVLGRQEPVDADIKAKSTLTINAA